MSDIQMIAVGVAAAIVLLLILALLVTRRRAAGSQKEQSVGRQPESLVRDAPQDTPSGLGKAGQPAAAPRADEAAAARQEGSHALEGQGPPVVGEPAVQAEPAPEALPAAAIDDAARKPAAGREVSEAEYAGPPASQMVPLSEVIVTTSGKMVDLQDPEVRKMLTGLVRLEVDQAIEYRRHGQTVDAMMQLAEAEKISLALGLTESAERVRRMVEELKRRS